MSKKLSQKKGFTLVEMLCTVVIMLLMSALVTMGFRLALYTMDDSAMTTEAQILCSTLSTKVYDRVLKQGAASVFVREGDDGKTARFGNSLEMVTLSESQDPDNFTGEPLTVIDFTGDKIYYDVSVDREPVELLPSKSYPDGIQVHMVVTRMDYEGTDFYRVKLEVLNRKGAVMAESIFDVDI